MARTPEVPQFDQGGRAAEHNQVRLDGCEGESRLRLTDAEIAAWKALPPATDEELRAIRAATQEEEDRAVDAIFRAALDKVAPRRHTSPSRENAKLA